MIKAKSTNDRTTLGIKYFYELFLKRKRLYPISYFLFPIKTRKKSIPLPDKLFKNIISTYLDIYFKEFYFHDTPKYFPLSGLIKKTKGKRFYANMNRGIVNRGRGITWLWYFRPSIAFFSNIRLLKMNGSTNRVLALDKKYKENKDVELLPNARSEMREVILFKN